VNYLNTAPLIYGLENSIVKDRIELIPDYPANLARDLIDGTIDLGLVPVAVIPELQQWWLIGDHCIGCEGPVASVCIFSDVPIEKVERVLLDYQSRTSVELAKLLIRDYWKIDAELVEAGKDFREEIRGTTAGLVIGDRSFEQRKISRYAYDLGEAWKAHTGLPFVFAAWISNKPLGDDFVKLFNDANAYGVHHVADVIAKMQNNNSFDFEEYFRKYISYHLDDEKKKGLNKFLQYLSHGVTG
jgi:chorismate dehydratase